MRFAEMSCTQFTSWQQIDTYIIKNIVKSQGD